MKKILAFSMIEIVVTLCIIGVIAAMTMPAIRQEASNRQYSTTLKKIYSDLSQATTIAISENSVNNLCRTGLFGSSNTFEQEFVLKNLNVTKKCSNVQECFGGANQGVAPYAGAYRYLLANGASIAFSFSACSNSGDMGLPIYVDVNGPKAPNKAGKDQFRLQIDNKGNVYTGTGRDAMTGTASCKPGSDDYTLAWSCAAKIQQDGWNIKF